jgi:hypothetical protein
MVKEDAAGRKVHVRISCDALCPKNSLRLQTRMEIKDAHAHMHVYNTATNVERRMSACSLWSQCFLRYLFSLRFLAASPRACIFKDSRFCRFSLFSWRRVE